MKQSALAYLRRNHKALDIKQFYKAYGNTNQDTSETVYKNTVRKATVDDHKSLQTWAKKERSLNFSNIDSEAAKNYWYEISAQIAAQEQKHFSIIATSSAARDMQNSLGKSKAKGKESVVDEEQEVQGVEAKATQTSMPKEIPFIDSFIKKFSLMNNSKKWYLETGKCVEDALFEFGLTCNFEHLAHSFTIDPSDQTLLKQNVFTAKELAEIKKKALIPFPDLNVSLTEYLAAFNQKSTSGLRKALYNCKWYEDYDENEHASLDWIRRSIDTLLPLYEKKIMNEKHNEQWYQKRIWFMIDTLFEIIPDLRIVRGENSSSSSSARKNIDRGAACFENLARKRMGRRGDFILRYHDIELACGEDKASDNGTNMMQDRGIKCPKMMRDMLWALLDSVKFNQEKSKKLTILGVTTFGLNLYLDWMTIHEGYVCVLVRSKKISMPSTIDSFPSSLSLFASLLSALEVIKSVINVMNANDVYDIELLKPSLKRAYSEDDDESNDAKSWSRIVSASTPEDNGRFRRVSGA